MLIDFTPTAYSEADTGFGRDKTLGGDHNFGFLFIESETLTRTKMPH